MRRQKRRERGARTREKTGVRLQHERQSNEEREKEESNDRGGIGRKRRKRREKFARLIRPLLLLAPLSISMETCYVLSAPVPRPTRGRTKTPPDVALQGCKIRRRDGEGGTPIGSCRRVTVGDGCGPDSHG